MHRFSYCLLLSLALVIFSSRALEDVETLRAENAKLRGELERLRAAFIRAHIVTPEPLESIIEGNTTADAQRAEEAKASSTGKLEFIILFCGMVFLWMLPFMAPFRRCCETKRHRIFPVITLFNVSLLVYALYNLHGANVNEIFFSLVEMTSVLISQIEGVLTGITGLMVLFVLWKFKDRVLEVLGIENPHHVIGEWRDWATCWSMKRFHPIELFIWKVEGIPSAKLHAANDIFVEVSLGYNSNLRTRVHHKVGHSCVFKESVQLNFDPFDYEARCYITVKNQDILTNGDIASVQLGVHQMQRFEESYEEHERLGWGASQTEEVPGSVWAPSRYRGIDLIPSGRIYMRFSPVRNDAEESCWNLLCPCCPRRSRPQPLGSRSITTPA